MNNYYKHILLLFRRLIVALIAFQLSRIFFFLFNLKSFDAGFWATIKIFLCGIRYDWYTIVIINSIFILLHISPGNFKNNFNLQKFLKYLFFIVNSAALLLNFIDIEYFKYIGKRSTSDFFSLIMVGDEFWDQLPGIISSFWYILLTWIFTVLVMVMLYPIFRKVKYINFGLKKKELLYQTGIAIFIISFSFFTVRGFGYKPTNILSGLNVSSSRNLPFLLNTPFTMMQTLEKSDLKPVNYIPKEKIQDFYSPIYYKKNSTGKKRNIIVIVIKNLSKEFTSYYTDRKKTYTPFLDSLLNSGLAFTNCYANGNMTIKSFSSIYNGLPSLMKEPYIISEFASDRIFSIGEVLQKYGYSTSFFYGGKNGSMRLNQFSKIAGFENYYGRNQYPNKRKDYDGESGIYDDKFFNYIADELNTMHEPKFAGILSLSSNHPYSIPEQFKNKLSKTDNELLKSIEYTDYSLKLFFHKIAKTSWYENTLFIITSDHNCFSGNTGYFDRFGIYKAPLIFFCPADSTLKGRNNTICQHSDIFPTILDYTGISDSIICFGKSLFESTKPRIVANYKNDIYEFLIGKRYIEFDGEKIIGIYNINEPKNNLLNNEKMKKFVFYYEVIIKSYIQQYNNRILLDELTKLQ